MTSENSPIADVGVETTEVEGGPASRVRISLAEAVAYRVRSERNTILIDFDKPAARTRAQTATLGRGGSPPVMDPIAALTLRGQTAKAQPAPTAQAAAQAAPGPAMATTQVATAQAPQAAATQAAVAQAAAQAPTAGAPTSGCVQPMGQKTFNGNPVSMDFQGADLRAVLRTFSEISGLNLVIDPNVQGTVDVALRDVPWDQALDIILSANKLTYCVDGTIVRIAPRAVFKAEEDERKALIDAQTDAGDLTTFTRQLSYAKGEDMATLLKSANVLTRRGQANVDARTNTLIVRDLPAQMTQITMLIEAIDKAQPQVEIEARIVETNKTFSRALGVQWGFNGRVDPSLGNTTNLAFPNNGSLGGRTGGTVNGTTVPNAVNMPAASPNAPISSAVGLALGSINGAFNLDVVLSAAEKRGDIKLLSTPRVITQNNVAAEVAQGRQIPYQTVANNTVTVQFKDAALVLKVVPQITAANTVIMNISVDNGSVGENIATSTGTIPSINTQRANTTVLLNDGETTVIGGVYRSSDATTTSRTPGLARVPLLKWLFKNDALDTSTNELLIFLTPRIVR